MRSVMVGTSTSARAIAAARAAAPIGVSSRLSSVSNSSRIRVSTGSGSLRVTTTFGLRAAMGGLIKGLCIGRGEADRWRPLAKRLSSGKASRNVATERCGGALRLRSGGALAGCGAARRRRRRLPAAGARQAPSGYLRAALGQPQARRGDRPQGARARTTRPCSSTTSAACRCRWWTRPATGGASAIRTAARSGSTAR